MKAGMMFFMGLKNSGDMAINIGAINILKQLDFESINTMSRYDIDSQYYLESERFINKHHGFLRM